MENQPSIKKQKFTVEIEGLTLEVRYSPKPFVSADIEHFEIITLNPERAPHPLSETGYKSLFIHPEQRTNLKLDPQKFIQLALEQEAQKQHWQKGRNDRQQLSLF